MKRKKEKLDQTENAASQPTAHSADLSYETLDPDFLASVPVPIVASIAAALPASLCSVERMRMAYELLDIGAYCYEHLKGGTDPRCYHQALLLFGLQSHLKVMRRNPIDPAFLDSQSDILPRDWETCETEQLLTLSFDLELVLRRIFGRAFSKVKRMQRFVAFLDDTRGDLGVILDWKEKGVPIKDFARIWSDFPEWWGHQKHAAKVKAGKAKKSPPKGKQGRVRSAKDKRLGARLPKIS